MEYITDILSKDAIEASSVLKELMNDPEVSTTWNPLVGVCSVSVPSTPQTFGMTMIDWDGFYRKLLDATEEDMNLPFQFLENVPVWSKSAKYTDVSDIMGRFEDIQIYNGASSQDITINLKYAADSLYNEDYSSPWSLESVKGYIKKIQSTILPVYDERFMPPPTWKLNIGSFYQEVPINIRDVAITPAAPFYIKTGDPMFYEVTLTCKTNYPMWQTQSFGQVFSTKAYEVDGDVFAYQELKYDKLR